MKWWERVVRRQKLPFLRYLWLCPHPDLHGSCGGHNLYDYYIQYADHEGVAFDYFEQEFGS